MYQIVFKKSADKELQKLPNTIVKRIVPAIDDLSKNPRPKGSKKLEGTKENIWRIRIGDYRVVYFIEDKIRIVEVRRIGHRKDVYEK